MSNKVVVGAAHAARPLIGRNYWGLSHVGAQMVGALNTAPGKPLPADLQQFLDQMLPSGRSSGRSEVAGAVYVSVGTIVLLEEPEVLGLAANLASLDRPVLWKISNAELPGDSSLKGGCCWPNSRESKHQQPYPMWHIP